MNMKNMNKRVINEPPILILEGGSSYDEWRKLKIYVSDLKEMNIGEELYVGSSIIRDTRIESIKCLFKDEEGILLLHSIEEWDDKELGPYDDHSPDNTIEELLYISFH